jgi:hypothetical protein
MCQRTFDHMKTSRAIYLPSLLFAIAGGVYFGFFSCGGYASYHTYYWLLFYAILVTTASLQIAKKGKTHSARLVLWFILLWAFAIHVVYFVSEASAAAFYPDSPDSVSEFARRFANAFFRGPC